MTKLDGKRARLHGPRELCFEDVSYDLAKLGPTELCGATEYSTVSLGTEKAAYMGLPALRPGPIYPRLVGYCNAARVVAVGAEVKSVAAGARVLTHQSHQSCFVCDVKDVIATIPPTLDSRTASMTYVAHIALNALQRAAFQPGESVVVQGLGPIGLSAVALARALCAGVVVAVGNDQSRMDKASTLGASLTVASNSVDLARQVADATGGALADIVVTTVNAWSGWRTSLSVVREFGRIAVLGFPGRGQTPPDFNPFEAQTFYTKQPSILSAGLAAGPGIWGDGDRGEQLRRNMRLLLGLVLDGRLPMAQLITHEVPWSELGRVYALAESGDKSLLGAVLRW
jgi:threonine dehydrogenase-like Zn-dependent dehydrogenase